MDELLERTRGEFRPHKLENRGLAISVFGALTATFGGKPIDMKLRKGAALIGYLCLQENLTARRDRLAFLLWSESDNNSARTSLRQTLISLRRAFRLVGCNALKTSKATVSLECPTLEIDFKRIMEATIDGRIDDTLLSVERLPEILLEGAEELDDEFRMWLLPTRQAFHNRLERLLSTRLNDAATPEQSKMLTARALLRVDPTNEAALHYEVLSFAQRGDVVGALRLYRRFETLLANEYDLKPSSELQMLLTRIQKESALRNASSLGGQAQPSDDSPRKDDRLAPAGRGSARQTIVIRLDPFAVQGVCSSKSYLISGFRHALTASLVRFREWIVVDGSQIVDAAKTPGFDYALQATIYEVDGAIEVVLTLLRMQDSTYLWSQIVRLQLDRWLATQHDIIRGLAATLQVRISAERLGRSGEKAANAVTAFDLWLRARAAVFSLDGTGLQNARKSLIAVAEINPTYSPLFSALAQIDNVESFFRPGVSRTGRTAQSAVEYSRRAVQLDAVDSRAHLALGWAYAFKWDFESAIPHMRLAVELNESDPWPQISAALFWSFANREDLASQSLAAFYSRSKSVSAAETSYLARIHFLKREFELSAKNFDSTQMLVPNNLGWAAAALALCGRAAEAKKTAAEFIVRTRSAWVGPLSSSEENIVEWLFHAHPFRHFPHWAAMREGIQKSGLPVKHLEHATYIPADYMQKVEV